MKYRSFAPVALGAAIVFCGCGDTVSPDLTSQPQFHQEGTGTPVTVVAAVLDLSDPSQPSNFAECFRVDNQGRVRFVRCKFTGPITGDLVGTEPISILNLKVDASGNGLANGSFTFDVCHTTLGCGQFEGHFNGPITFGAAVLAVKGRGTTGDFVGLQMRGTSSSPGNNIFALDLTIH